MQTYRDAKRMAKALEAALRDRNITISHGQSLDLVARQFGLADWNVLAARLKQSEAKEQRRLEALTAWSFLAEHPTEFDHGLDRNARGPGRNAAIIRYAHPANAVRYPEVSRVFGCYVQEASAIPLQGRRIEITAELSAERVSHGATIWARVTGRGGPGDVMAFDNLQDRPDGGWIYGDQTWTRRRIVIEVPQSALVLGFGFFLKGTGTLRAADFGIREVDSSVPLTSPLRAQSYAWSGLGPKNLDFAEVLHAAEEHGMGRHPPGAGCQA